MTFEVVVRSGNANVVTATTATCNVELKPGEGQPFQDGATYTVSVRKRTTNAASSPLTATITIAQLAAPTGLQVISEGYALAAQWQPVAGAADYEAQILDARGNPLDSQPHVDYEGTTAQADAGSLENGALYSVRVRPLVPPSRGPWSDAIAFTASVVALSAPAITGTTTQGHELVVNWEEVFGATGYEAVLLNPGGVELDPQPPITYTGTSARADAADLPVGTYAFKVRAIGNTFVTPFSAPTSVVRMPTAPPTAFTVVYAADMVHAAWQRYEGVDSFAMSFSNSQGFVFVPQPDVKFDGTTAVADVSALAPGAYNVTLAVMYEGKVGVISDPVAFNIPGGWSPRHSAAAAVFNSRIWIMGGSERGLNSLQDVWSSADGINWEQAPAPPWGRRFEAYAAVVRNRLYLLGGFDMLGNEQPGTQAHNIVVGCSDVPLTEWSWFEDDTKPGVVVSIWTAGGWKLLDGTTQLSAVVPYRGLYYYRVALRNVAMLQGRAALLSSQKTAANVVFYVPPTQMLPSPIPAGYAPVVADSAGTLIDELFNVHGDEPRLVYGQFSALGSAVTATPDSGIYKILFGLGGTASALYTVNSSLVACSDTPLTEWGWYQADQKPAGVTSVWTEHGWQNVSPNKLDDATPFRRLYFYRIDLNNAQVPGQMSALITSREQSATVVFFTRVGSTRA